MVSFNKFFTSVYLAVVYASISVSAAPWETTSKHHTHREFTVGKRGLKITSYNPASEYTTFGAGVDHPLRKRADASLGDSAVEFVKEKLGLDASAVEFKTGYDAETSSYAYIKQRHDGIDFANSVANVAFKNNKVVAFGNSFVKPTKIADTKPTVALSAAIATAEKQLAGKYNSIPAKLEYLVKEDHSVVLTHVVQIQNEAEFTWYQAHVDAHSGELVSVVNFMADAVYRVLPINKEYPTEGFETLTNPEVTAASPNGWLNDGTTTYTTTQGNNIVSYKSSVASTAPQSAAGQFVYTWSSTTAPTTANNINVAKVNSFYLGNHIHDTTYLYGFTEAAYNFQKSNLGKAGKANDHVKISNQDSSGTNNANFGTPPDGQSGQMNMFLWTLTSPQRDGSLENDIVIHEYTHGITNRMTGGGTASCLQTTVAGGMGEGWGDALAAWFSLDSATIPNFDMGVFVYTQGIRSYPYSTSATTNPQKYSTLATLNEVHDIGEVWANTLYNVLAQLVAANGYSATAKTDATGTSGNVVWLHLFIDALALQPCNPTFISGRDAWLQADVNRYAGANKCAIWKGFASKGVGSGATTAYKDVTTLPAGC